MTTVLRLCREYGAGFDGWDHLDRGMQAMVLADDRKRQREAARAAARARSRGRRHA